MAQLASGVLIARRVAANALETINVIGPSIEFLTPLEERDDAPCLMRGTIPPGVAVPLHSHADSETFLQVSGEVEALVEAEGGFDWVRIRIGDVFYAPGGAKHAFRNQGQELAVMILVSTCRMGRFFREISVPAAFATGAPSGETIRHFLQTSARYGYWNATPEENARVGISLPL
jgi:quercetin dioxygenase-like cupin family protein